MHARKMYGGAHTLHQLSISSGYDQKLYHPKHTLYSWLRCSCTMLLGPAFSKHERESSNAEHGSREFEFECAHMVSGDNRSVRNTIWPIKFAWVHNTRSTAM